MHASTGSFVFKTARVGQCCRCWLWVLKVTQCYRSVYLALQLSAIGLWLSVSITSGFSQDLDKDIGAAAQKREKETEGIGGIKHWWNKHITRRSKGTALLFICFLFALCLHSSVEQCNLDQVLYEHAGQARELFPVLLPPHQRPCVN
jgi:hypothetical protein